MRTLTLLFVFVFALPFALGAQLADQLLQKMSGALAAEQDDYAVSLFRQLVNERVETVEMYYWARVDKSSDVAPRLVNELALYYRTVRNYDKTYLFYKEFLQYYPGNVDALVACAEASVMRGKEKEALALYEKILLLNANNLQANVFLGNYYYLQAEREKNRLERDYKQIVAPTRMQNARYRNGFSDLFSTSYAKAKKYLQRVIRLYPSMEAGKTLEKIKRLETEMH